MSLAAALGGMTLLTGVLACLLVGRPESAATWIRDGTVYQALTARFGAGVGQAVLGGRHDWEVAHQLLAWLTVTGLAGLVVAMITGVLVAHRALDALADVLDKRRRFVADASHELRAPLTRLHVRSQLLLRRADDVPEPLLTELRRMVADTRELGEVLDDMLRDARLRSDAPASERVDLVAVAADLLAAEAGRLSEREIVAVLDAESEPLLVPGVRSALRRMLSALVDNAIRHTPPEGRIVVSVAATDRGRTVELVVEDTGVGFDPARHLRVFDRFTRGTAEGFGIGLALVLDVVESHGGTIVAAGRPGEGARFTVRLPAAANIGSQVPTF